MATELGRFGEAVAAHGAGKFLDDPAMRARLTLSADRLPRSGRLLEVLYAPFEHIETGAELVIVGITPGATQAEAALTEARAALRRGLPIPEAARVAKVAASFSGAMRANLLGMLDAVGAPGWFGIRASEDLFAASSHRVHFTSALRNPVFIDGKNYNGQGGQPGILAHPVLRAVVEDTLAAEARALPDAYWLPLWDVPDAALRHLVARGDLRADRVLPPMPHPGGGNGENIAWFRGTTKATAFSSRRASTGPLLLRRRDALREFFASRQVRKAG